MDNIARTMKRKRDAEARQRTRAPVSGQWAVQDTGDGSPEWVNPVTDFTAHAADVDAHHDKLHAADHAGGQVDELTPAAIGAVDTTTYGTHTGDADAHHDQLHAASHATGEADALAGHDIGAGEVYRFDFDEADTDTFVVTHSLGAYPLVQVITGSAYGSGNYGDGDYGDPDMRLISPTSIVHNSVNALTVTLAAAAAGTVICIG